MNHSRCNGDNSSTITWNKFTVVYLKSLELYLWTRRFGCQPQKDKRCNALQRVTLHTMHKAQATYFCQNSILFKQPTKQSTKLLM